RGGLPPRALRRVREFIETHLEETISIEALAAAAGLSTYHFARAFKQSEGVTPHGYLVQRRVKRAQELLAGTDLPLSEIAVAGGLAQQKHLCPPFSRACWADAKQVSMVDAIRSSTRCKQH